MREIKFRAKPALDEERIEELKKYMNGYYDGKFVYGNLIKDNWIVGKVVDSEEEWIALEYWIPVIPETVGQFTGRQDMNKTDVYEGDVLSTKERDVKCVVVYDIESTSFKFISKYGSLFDIDGSLNQLEIIGNIHDNPELLEVSNA